VPRILHLRAQESGPGASIEIPSVSHHSTTESSRNSRSSLHILNAVNETHRMLHRHHQQHSESGNGYRGYRDIDPQDIGKQMHHQGRMHRIYAMDGGERTDIEDSSTDEEIYSEHKSNVNGNGNNSRVSTPFQSGDTPKPHGPHQSSDALSALNMSRQSSRMSSTAGGDDGSSHHHGSGHHHHISMDRKWNTTKLQLQRIHASESMYGPGTEEDFDINVPKSGSASSTVDLDRSVMFTIGDIDQMNGSGLLKEEEHGMDHVEGDETIAVDHPAMY